jgi:hypothetical protein
MDGGAGHAEPGWVNGGGAVMSCPVWPYLARLSQAWQQVYGHPIVVADLNENCVYPPKLFQIDAPVIAC